MSEGKVIFSFNAVIIGYWYVLKYLASLESFAGDNSSRYPLVQSSNSTFKLMERVVKGGSYEAPANGLRRVPFPATLINTLQLNFSSCRSEFDTTWLFLAISCEGCGIESSSSVMWQVSSVYSSRLYGNANGNYTGIQIFEDLSWCVSSSNPGACLEILCKTTKTVCKPNTPQNMNPIVSIVDNHSTEPGDILV